MGNHPNSSRIVLKGSGGGLRLVIPEGISEKSICSQTVDVLEKASNLIESMEVIVDTGRRLLSRGLICSFLTKVVCPVGMRLAFWSSDDVESEILLRAMGFRTVKADEALSVAKKPGGKDTLVLRRSLRSGQSVEHIGDVVLFGHVNDGAEILATGNICVVGKLQGLAHSVCDGDGDGVIIAEDFRAKQVRIGHKVSVCPEPEKQNWWGKPAIVFTEQDSLVIREFKGQ